LYVAEPERVNFGDRACGECLSNGTSGKRNKGAQRDPQGTCKGTRGDHKGHQRDHFDLQPPPHSIFGQASEAVSAHIFARALHGELSYRIGLVIVVVPGFLADSSPPVARCVALVAEDPEVPCDRGRCFRKLRHPIFIREPFGGVLRGEQSSKLRVLEIDDDSAGVESVQFEHEDELGVATGRVFHPARTRHVQSVAP